MKKLIIGLTLILLVLIIAITYQVRYEVPELETQEIYISSNQTLWGLGEKYCPENMDVRQWIFDVKKLNGMKTSEVYEGSTIKILKELK